MGSQFVAFIDESGDEGFVFRPNDEGSSRWFVLSAAVFRGSNARSPVRALERARTVLRKGAKTPLHFKDLKHEQRVAYVSEIAKESFRCVSVLVHKPSLPEPERYQANGSAPSGKFLLYKYATRLLLERVSWLCRDAPVESVNDPTVQAGVDLVFSDRAAMSYESLRQYLTLIRDQSAYDARVKIDWTQISPDRVRAVAHSKLAGLQVADALASSIHWAVKLSRYGHAEPRYASLLTKHCYSHRGQRIGYGLKFWPDIGSLVGAMPHLSELDRK